jgi:hypothetical protein
MAISVFPAPSTQDKWQLIGSNTPTSGSVISFTSIAPEWRKFWLLGYPIVSITAAARLLVTANSVGTAASYQWTNSGGTNTYSISDPSFSDSLGTGTDHSMNLTITNPSASYPAMTWEGFIRTAVSARGPWQTNGFNGLVNTAITQIDLTLNTSSFSASNTGTVYLYGTY